jgi:hypothetical protein
MVVPLVADGKKCGIAHQRADIELAPASADIVLVLGTQPGGGSSDRLARAQLRRVAQPEGAVDEQRSSAAEALAEKHEARLLAAARRASTEERGEIDDAAGCRARSLRPGTMRA